MTSEEKKVLITYRLERATESIKAAELMFTNKMFIPAMNRIYYSMFYAVQALLVLEDKVFGKHGQVKGYFNKKYIKEKIFPNEYGKLYNSVFAYRQKFDYVDLITPDEKLIIENIQKAHEFINTISLFLQKKITAF